MTLTDDMKSCPLFADLSAEELTQLEAIVHRRKVQRGELLFSDGDAAKGFYVVVEGRVKVYKLSADGKERILHIVQPGSTFAEAAIFGDGNYPAYAEPLVTSTLLFFPKRDFLNLLHNQSQMAINMIAGLSRYLRQFATQVEQLTFQDVPARLAKYLLTLPGAATGRVVLPISKGQLASNLGTVSETLSRTLRKLADEGLLAVEGKNITLLDSDELEELAISTKER
ncbi:MAG: Crp/Fnr family transcriptional regulator [Desulfuromonadales bacterium]|nr:Crp/Fnr family transcriptional regulator [Desulfuromonadales bacterium]